MVADRRGADGYDFEAATDAVQKSCRPFNVTRINRGAQTADAGARIVGGINAGLRSLTGWGTARSTSGRARGSCEARTRAHSRTRTPPALRDDDVSERLLSRTRRSKALGVSAEGERGRRGRRLDFDRHDRADGSGRDEPRAVRRALRRGAGPLSDSARRCSARSAIRIGRAEDVGTHRRPDDAREMKSSRVGKCVPVPKGTKIIAGAAALEFAPPCKKVDKNFRPEGVHSTLRRDPSERICLLSVPGASLDVARFAPAMSDAFSGLALRHVLEVVVDDVRVADVEASTLPSKPGDQGRRPEEDEARRDVADARVR